MTSNDKVRLEMLIKKFQSIAICSIYHLHFKEGMELVNEMKEMVELQQKLKNKM